MKPKNNRKHRNANNRTKLGEKSKLPNNDNMQLKSNEIRAACDKFMRDRGLSTGCNDKFVEFDESENVTF